MTMKILSHLSVAVLPISVETPKEFFVRVLVTCRRVHSYQSFIVIVHVLTNLGGDTFTLVFRQSRKYGESGLVLSMVTSVRPIWCYTLPCERAQVPRANQFFVPARTWLQNMQFDCSYFRVVRATQGLEPMHPFKCNISVTKLVWNTIFGVM